MRRQRGFSLIEVMISIVIMSVGLIGLAGLQARALTAQKEAYQRSQALVLAKDMVDRILANRAQAATSSVYRVDPGSGDTPRGTGFNGSAAVNCSGLADTALLDLCEWHNNLLGASTSGTATLIGARGCVYEVTTAVPKNMVVVVTWQGYSPTAAPPSAINCGQGSYGANDALRRAITLPLNFPLLN